MNKPFLIVVAGPTASGKTSLSITLARHFQTEILSGDSRQFYRELTIGTAKPTLQELELVKHHFIDSLTLDEDYNISRFEMDALACLDQLFRKKKVALLCGGSGLYLQAVCKGMDALPERDPVLRKQLEAELEKEGISILQKRIQELDPAYYAKSDLSNPHRLIRAIEVCLLTGKRYSELRTGTAANRNFNVLKIGLEIDRELLYDRINKRVDLMMINGLEEEARSVFHQRHLNALNTVGYKEIFDFFDGKTDRDTAIAMIKQNTRNYAKRQLTWFKRDPDIHWFPPSAEKDIIRFLEQKLQVDSNE